jgi:hypothetical protein
VNLRGTVATNDQKNRIEKLAEKSAENVDVDIQIAVHAK